MALKILKRFLCNTFFPIVCFSLYISSNGNHVQKCAGLDTAGYTYPHGDIVIEYGNSLEIYCVINNLTKNATITSADIYFNINDKDAPPEKITIINDTAIKFYDPKPPKSNAYYSCLLHPKIGVCANKVAIAVKPQNVTDFHCIALNYENLTCSWTAPNNEIKTEYELSYTFKGRTPQYSVCSKLTLEGNKYTCFWNDTTDPQYRPAQPKYMFTLKMNNALGHNSLNYTFDHYANVLPGPPEKLRCINVTTNSIFLNWSIPNNMGAFPRALDHRLLYQCDNGPKEWKFAGKFSTKDVLYATYNITGIPHAHNLCDVRVSLRSNLSTSEELWSKNSSINVRTMSKRPGAAPKTDIGSFEKRIVGNNVKEVYIYWQQIPDAIKNGEDFKYKVAIVGSNRGELEEDHAAYARFTDLEDKDYTFEIWSQNSVGLSADKSYVYVPHKKINEPRSFIKTSFGSGKYELSWKEPLSDGDYEYTNYTLFWCVNSKDLPFQCKGHLNWTVVPINTTAFNITVDDSLSPQFAISANTNKGSSGMIWAACTLIHNQSIGKMKTVWINNIGSDFIDVGWKLDCSDRIMSVEGFIIYYCPILSPREATCKGLLRNVSFPGDSTIVHGIINNLTPYTTYMLRVAVISRHLTYSQQSDPLFNTTLEAAPSSPINVTIVGVTNSSVSITWQKPNPTNGVIKYYLIEYNNNSVNFTPPNHNEIKYNLTNLSSYVEYSISIKACTISCSVSSSLVKATTEVGSPDTPDQPAVGFQNVSLIEVKWEKPKTPRGRIDFYDVKFKQKLHGDNRTTVKPNFTDTRYIIEDCGEGGTYESFFISVRAVNVWNGERIESKWSPELEYYCRTTSKYMYWLLIPILLAVGIFMFYVSKRFYFYCQEMQNVDIKLPPGLVPTINDHNWSIQKSQEETPQYSPGDEELLLIKMNGISSGDSSGCSSGHESVSSSAESGKSSSSSDSGTEQPIAVSTDDLRKNSLRLRNLSTKPSPTKGYVTMPTDNIFTPNNYCVIGVDPNQQTETDTTYIPINALAETIKMPYQEDDAAKSTPYVLTGDITKTNCNDYVPHNFPKLVAKSPA